MITNLNAAWLKDSTWYILPTIIVFYTKMGGSVVIAFLKFKGFVTWVSRECDSDV
jgi:hypothetical protein